MTPELTCRGAIRNLVASLFMGMDIIFGEVKFCKRRLNMVKGREGDGDGVVSCHSVTVQFHVPHLDIIGGGSAASERMQGRGDCHHVLAVNLAPSCVNSHSGMPPRGGWGEQPLMALMDR